MIVKLVTAVGRLSPVPLLVRLGVFLSGVAGLLLVTPTGLLSWWPVAAGLALLPLLAALLPGGAWVTTLVVVTVGGWLAATIAYGEPVTVVRVLALAGVLYLLHSLATLAAALPYDAAVGPDVWARWLLRTVLVIAASSLLSVAVLAGIAQVAGAGVYVAASLAGLALAAGLTTLLSALSRR